MMNRKSSIPMNTNRRKSGSMGFRQYMMGGGSQDTNELPSVSRPRPSTSFVQNMSVRQSLMPPDMPASSTRMSRLSYNGNKGRKRSSSQEPPTLDKRRTVLPSPSVFDQHHPSAGLLLTPNRPTTLKSPGFSLASSQRSASSRRNSSRLHVVPDTSLKIKDPRQINDKDFKNNAYIRIQNFMRNTSVKVKPLSNSVLVQTFNAIYKELDPNIQVNNTDYADKVSNIVKAIGYPAAISRTSFVSVSSGHAITQVLAFLSWLVDCVEVVQSIDIENACFPNCDVDQEQKLVRTLTRSIMDLFREYKVLKDAAITADRVEETFLINMEEEMDEEYNLDVEIKALNDEIAKLESDPKNEEDMEKVAQITMAEKRNETIKLEIEDFINQASVLKSKMNTEKESIKTLEMDCTRIEGMSAELADRISRQPVKHTERDRMVARVEELNKEIKAKTEHMTIVSEISSKTDLKISKLQSEIQAVIHDINAIVLENQLDQFKWNHNPLHSDAEVQVKNARTLWISKVEKLESKAETTERAVEKIMKDLDEYKSEEAHTRDEVESILEQCQKLDLQINADQGHVKMREQELKEKLGAMKKNCFTLKNDIDALPKLEELYEMINKCISDQRAEKQSFAERKNFLETCFFPKFHQKCVEFAEKLGEEVDGVFRKIHCPMPNTK